MNASRLRVHALLAGTAVLALLAAAAGGEMGGGAVRAVGVVALLAVGAAALGRRRARSSGPTLVQLEERHLLARDAGVAVFAVGGSRLVVGFGTSGVALLTHLRAGGEGEQ